MTVRYFYVYFMANGNFQTFKHAIPNILFQTSVNLADIFKLDVLLPSYEGSFCNFFSFKHFAPVHSTISKWLKLVFMSLRKMTHTDWLLNGAESYKSEAIYIKFFINLVCLVCIGLYLLKSICLRSFFTQTSLLPYFRFTWFSN